MESVIYEIRDRIAYVTINRPEAYNACDQPTYDRLADVWTDFARNDEAWVAILTGAGDKAFCAGSDIKKNFNSLPDPAESFAGAGRGDLMRGLEIWKPVIAAVNGHCNGGGLEQALSCDIRIASDNAQFGLGEVLLGLLPGGGGTQRLPRTIPLGHALWMLYSGERIEVFTLQPQAGGGRIDCFGCQAAAAFFVKVCCKVIILEQVDAAILSVFGQRIQLVENAFIAFL